MTVSDEVEVTPALFDHAKRVYDEMLKRSTKELAYPSEGEGSPTAMADVYTGHTTRLFSDLGIANPYYTKIMEALKGQGCIDQVRRGGGQAMSRWVLNFPPEEEGFRAIMDRKRPKVGKAAEVDQRVKDLTKLTNVLYEQLEALEGQVSRLSAEFNSLRDDIKRSAS